MHKAILLERNHQKTYVPIDFIDNRQDYLILVPVSSKFLPRILSAT